MVVLTIVFSVAVAAVEHAAVAGDALLAAQPACDLTGWWSNQHRSADNMTITQVSTVHNELELVPANPISASLPLCP